MVTHFCHRHGIETGRGGEYVRTCDDRKRPSAGSNNHILSHAVLVSGGCAPLFPFVLAFPTSLFRRIFNFLQHVL